MVNLSKQLEAAKTIGISGHIRPDGDCVGSTMALYLYIKKTRPEADVHIFLEKPSEIFSCIEAIDEIEDAKDCSIDFDVFFAIDCGKERLGDAERLFDNAKCTINIDHHISNPGTGAFNYIVPSASSASELVYDLIDTNKLDAEIAKALYIGIIHDCGVFQYSNTSEKTLITAAQLVSFGFDFPKLIEETFYEKTYEQTRIMGRVLDNSTLSLDGLVAIGVVTKEMMEEFGVNAKELDGIVNQLRNIKGVDTAMFLYELPTGEFKVSLRSGGKVDVAAICKGFGGGGHVRAAGCTLTGSASEVTQTVLEAIKKALEEKAH